MRKLRILAGVLALMLIAGLAGPALGEYQRSEKGRCVWWGVLYGDALLLAQAEEEGDLPEDETEVVFVWPLWDWLMRFLGFQ